MRRSRDIFRNSHMNATTAAPMILHPELMRLKASNPPLVNLLWKSMIVLNIYRLQIGFDIAGIFRPSIRFGMGCWIHRYREEPYNILIQTRKDNKKVISMMNS